MGSVNFNNLRNTGKNAVLGYTYKDLHLDISEVDIRTGPTGQAIRGKDIQVDYDLDAILNSLRNIFKTRPGERFLVPTFGCNLDRYLFQPVSDATANSIGDEIVRAVTTWEPRVTIRVVNVTGYPDIHQYDVTISLIINDIKRLIDIGGNINTDTAALLDNLALVC
jgi:phage baseplate assembly protein W